MFAKLGRQADEVVCIEVCKDVHTCKSNDLTTLCFLPSFGGLILNKTISKRQYNGMAIFTPIICGRYQQSPSPRVLGVEAGS